jgi:arabinogalactan endo-1,4-beta-galactosidase
MRTWFRLFAVLSLLVAPGCNKEDGQQDIGQHNDGLLLGADLSLLPSYKDAGAVFKDEKGADVEPLHFLKQKGLDIVRCRLFVNPDPASGACQDIRYVTDFCREIQNAGMSIMLDFHYSDTWADPGKQTKPEAWSRLTAQELPACVYDYTLRSLQTLKETGISPSLIQIGNEVTNGMLWNDAGVSVWGDAWDTPARWSLFTSILAGASKACREVCPEAEIIIHTDRSADEPTARLFYTRLYDAGVDYDIIGLSYYPFWHGTLAGVAATLDMLRQRLPGKEVMFVEIAYPYRDWGYPSDSGYEKAYPATPEGQAAFVRSFLSFLLAYPQVRGALWWFAEETYSPHRRIHTDLHRGLFDNSTGKALLVLDVFDDFMKRITNQ